MQMGQMIHAGDVQGHRLVMNGDKTQDSEKVKMNKKLECYEVGPT